MGDKQINSDTIDKIDMLLGADYSHLVQTGIKTIGDGLALTTKVGLSLMGDLKLYKLGENQMKCETKE